MYPAIKRGSDALLDHIMDTYHNAEIALKSRMLSEISINNLLTADTMTRFFETYSFSFSYSSQDDNEAEISHESMRKDDAQQAHITELQKLAKVVRSKTPLPEGCHVQLGLKYNDAFDGILDVKGFRTDRLAMRDGPESREQKLIPLATLVVDQIR